VSVILANAGGATAEPVMAVLYYFYAKAFGYANHSQ